MKTVRLYLYGMVQGVGMRFTITQIAKKVGVKGFVKNLSDGSVEIVAQGEAHKVDDFIKRAKNARTGNITETSLETLDTDKTFNGFNVQF
ncbi:MAG: acylphosphatase [Bacillota bacterium]